MNKDDVIIICSTQNTAHTKGIRAFCTKCNASVWLSDSSIKSVKSKDPNLDLEKDPPHLLCETCGLPVLMGAKDLEIMNMTLEQKTEIIKAIKNLDKS